MKNRVIIFIGIVFFSRTPFLYSGDKEKSAKPEIALYDSQFQAAGFMNPLIDDSPESNEGYKGHFEGCQDGSIKDELVFAFLAKKFGSVSLRSKKPVSKEQILEKQFISLRAAAGQKPKKQGVLEVGESQQKIPHNRIQRVGPKAKGSLAFLSAQRRNAEKSYPGLFWDKRK